MIRTDSFFNPEASRALSFGTAVLLYATLVAVALAVALATYLICLDKQINLQNQQYLYWNGSLPWGDLFTFPNLGVWNDENIWYQFLPNNKLTFMFLPNSTSVSLTAGTTVLFGEILGCLSILKWWRTGSAFPMIFLLISFVTIGFGVSTLFPSGSDNCVVDIQNNKMTISFQSSTDSIPLPSASMIEAVPSAHGFTVRSCDGYSTAYCRQTTEVLVQYNNLSQTELFSLSSFNQAKQIQVMIKNFISSDGSII